MNDYTDLLRAESQQEGNSSCGCGQSHGNGSEGSFDECLTGKSLAMVYSPCQEFAGLYTSEEGLCRGTIFMELDKPFYGARRLK